jgi:hypothetical protein
MNIRWFDKVRNEDLWQRAYQDGMDLINTQIKKRKLAWIGHTLRKPPNSITRQALKWMNHWIFGNMAFVVLHVSAPYKSTDFTFELKIFIFVPFEMFLALHTYVVKNSKIYQLLPTKNHEHPMFRQSQK